MAEALIWILLALVAIPIALVVVWNLIKLFFVAIADIGHLIFGFVIFVIILFFAVSC
jgi:hypothetical protein